ncbi:hypothetical protein [Candidatus Methylacidiphilum infernorum]|uniref:Uncharacterized protein n=1 Tax=Methylacidiphilum infernorum (isolate V4) TaxID=481448 RepID=B3DY50_METI4|nr:hypothetical protein [Candidatus Methylacidiphilum infernorum]ACD82327.1 Hypothetical protein Minf_0267 [Methylacidiphilum infernorum V4]
MMSGKEWVFSFIELDERLSIAAMFSGLFLIGLVLFLLVLFIIFAWNLKRKETQLPPAYSEFLFSDEPFEEEEHWQE